MEMQVEDISYDKNNFNLNSILSEVKSYENQKIILLEIMALIYSDGLHEEEQKKLNMIIEQYNMSEALTVVYSEWSKSILYISKQGQALIRL